MIAKRFLRQNALFVGVVLLIVFFSTQSPAFLDYGNFKDVAVQSSIMGIIAVTSAILLLAGGVDLSIGSTVALGGVTTGLLLSSGWDPVSASIIGVLVGAGIGAVNGFLCATLGFSPIVVTLGMLTVVRGVAFFVQRDPVYDFGDSFGVLGRGSVLGIPVLVVFAAVVFALGGIFLRFTPWGRHTYAIGVNPEAAYLSGVAVRGLPFALYVATGASAGLGGVLLASRLNSASAADMAVGFELDVLTAVLLGGVAFGGGRGSLFGVLMGVIFLGLLTNGLILMNVFPFIQLIAKGGALVLAAGLDRFGTKLEERAGYQQKLDRARKEAAGSNGSSAPDAAAPGAANPRKEDPE